MTSYLQRILESKRALRSELTARPVAEKLQLLDAMREREVAIRSTAYGQQKSTVWRVVQR